MRNVSDMLSFNTIPSYSLVQVRIYKRRLEYYLRNIIFYFCIIYYLVSKDVNFFYMNNTKNVYCIDNFYIVFS